jgi:hypothetical protein
MKRRRGEVTFSQSHSPVAFLPQEHLTTPVEETVEELWVVKSTGRADMAKKYGYLKRKNGFGGKVDEGRDLKKVGLLVVSCVERRLLCCFY